MLSTSVHKDISEYKEKVIFGLSWRSIAGLAAGLVLGATIAVVGYLVAGLQAKDLSAPVLLAVGACFAAGYVEPYGLPFFDGAAVWLREATTPRTILYESSPARAEREKAAEAAKHATREEKRAAKARIRALERESDEIWRANKRLLAPERLWPIYEQARENVYGKEATDDRTDGR